MLSRNNQEAQILREKYLWVLFCFLQQQYLSLTRTKFMVGYLHSWQQEHSDSPAINIKAMNSKYQQITLLLASCHYSFWSSSSDVSQSSLTMTKGSEGDWFRELPTQEPVSNITAPVLLLCWKLWLLCEFYSFQKSLGVVQWPGSLQKRCGGRLFSPFYLLHHL